MLLNFEVTQNSLSATSTPLRMAVSVSTYSDKLAANTYPSTQTNPYAKRKPPLDYPYHSLKVTNYADSRHNKSSVNYNQQQN